MNHHFSCCQPINNISLVEHMHLWIRREFLLIALTIFPRVGPDHDVHIWIPNRHSMNQLKKTFVQLLHINRNCIRVFLFRLHIVVACESCIN